MVVFVCYTILLIIICHYVCTFCHEKQYERSYRKNQNTSSQPLHIHCWAFLSSLKTEMFTFSHFLWYHSSQIEHDTIKSPLSSSGSETKKAFGSCSTASNYKTQFYHVLFFCLWLGTVLVILFQGNEVDNV